MFNTSLKNVSFINTLTFALIMLVLQTTVVLGMKNLVLLLLTIAEDPLPCKTSLVWHSHLS